MILFKSALCRIFTNKIRFLLILILPLFFIYMWAAREYHGVVIGLVDEDQSITSQRITALIKHVEGIKIVETDRANMEDQTMSYFLEYSLIIDEGFEKALLGGEEPKLKEYYMEEKEKVAFLKSTLNIELNNLNMLAKAVGYDRDKYKEAIEEYSRGKLTILSKEDTAFRNIRTRLGIGFLIQFMLYMSVLTAGMILEDKVKGTFYRTFCAPISLKRYMSENMLAFLITAVVQPVFIILAMRYLFNLHLGEQPFIAFGVFTVFAIFCVSLGLFITSILKKPIQAYVIILLVTTPLVMLGGCYWEFNFMPDIMIRISQLIPVTYVMKMVDALLSGSMNLNTFIFNSGILLLFSAIFLALGLVKKVDIAK